MVMRESEGDNRKKEIVCVGRFLTKSCIHMAMVTVHRRSQVL